MCASFFTLLIAVVEVDGTRMSSNSVYDQFVCRVWLTRTPLYIFIGISTYGILLTALERYAAVIYHVCMVPQQCKNVLKWRQRHRERRGRIPGNIWSTGDEISYILQSSACTPQRYRNTCALRWVSLSAVFIQAVTYCPEQ